MKTIFTLLFSMAMFSTTFAQYGQKGQRDKDIDVYVSVDNKDFGHHDKKFGGYIFTPRERDMEIAKINREYGFKIQSVKNKSFMTWMQKKRIINNLEEQREDEIAQVIRKFRSPKNKFDDYGYGRKDRKNW
jgi:vacuolar-type H+-ATPase subunit I/STV1